MNTQFVSRRLEDTWSGYFYMRITWQIILRLIRSNLFIIYAFTFNVVIKHGGMTFQEINMDKLPKDVIATKLPTVLLEGHFLTIF